MNFSLLQIRKYLGYLSFYLLPIGLLIASLFLDLDSHFYEELGGYSWGLLVVILFLTPVAQITNYRWIHAIRGMRRELGVAAFWLFAFHGAGLVYLKRLYDVNRYLSPSDYLFWGTIAGLGMFVLGLTSNNLSQKILKKHWKTVQWIAIPVFFFATVHKFMAEHEGILPAIVLFVVYLAARYYGQFMFRSRKSSKS